MICWGFLVGSCYYMFQIKNVSSANNESNWWSDWNIVMTFSLENCNKMIESCIPTSVLIAWILLSFSIIKAITSQPNYKFLFIARGLVCAIWIGILAIPSLSLTQNLQNKGFVASDIFSMLWKETRYLQLSSGYGLFRRMTGVGIDPNQYVAFQQNKELQTRFGWAGLPPSIVARPEIIFEGLFKSSNGKEDNSSMSTANEWKEIAFRWKPGKLDDPPKQVAPHQPRLDWQMWFAALGNYQRNPWILALAFKILQGCSPVLDLLGDSNLLDENQHILKLRAKLYDYDFTRLDTDWNKKIPGSEIIAFAQENDQQSRQNYWKRTYKMTYIPEVDINSFNSGHGFQKCVPIEARCEQMQKGSSARLFCEATIQIRKHLLSVCTFFLAPYFAWLMNTLMA